MDTVMLERVERLATRALPRPFPDGLERTDDPRGLAIEWVQCARCGPGVEFADCWNCSGEGYSYHDCGEDCCACLDPEPNVVCDICRGKGSFGHCVNSQDWCETNPLPGREHVRSTAMSNEAWRDTEA